MKFIPSTHLIAISSPIIFTFALPGTEHDFAPQHLRRPLPRTTIAEQLRIGHQSRSQRPSSEYLTSPEGPSSPMSEALIARPAAGVRSDDQLEDYIQNQREREEAGISTTRALRQKGEPRDLTFSKSEGSPREHQHLEDLEHQLSRSNSQAIYPHSENDYTLDLRLSQYRHAAQRRQGRGFLGADRHQSTWIVRSPPGAMWRSASFSPLGSPRSIGVLGGSSSHEFKHLFWALRGNRLYGLEHERFEIEREGFKARLARHELQHPDDDLLLKYFRQYLDLRSRYHRFDDLDVLLEGINRERDPTRRKRMLEAYPHVVP